MVYGRHTPSEVNSVIPFTCKLNIKQKLMTYLPSKETEEIWGDLPSVIKKSQTPRKVTKGWKLKGVNK